MHPSRRRGVLRWNDYLRRLGDRKRSSIGRIAVKKKIIDKSTRAKIVAEYFAELDKHLLPASLAVLTRKKQSTPSQSCFGGDFVGRADTKWPHCRSVPMEGVLQIRTKDLPYCPPQLNGIALIQLFCMCEDSVDGFPQRPKFDEEGWYVVRTYDTLRGLRPMERPTPPNIKPCSIEWKMVSNEIPFYPADVVHIDAQTLERFKELPDSWKIVDKNYSSHWQTKVGGWPVSCQSGLDRIGYAIQIGSERKANFMWGDNGVAVLFHHRNQWRLDWDCY